MDPTVESTPIPGLLVVRLDVKRDERGWFAETWHRERMAVLGLPDFGPVQANVAWNQARGTTRGMHAEPWDKLVTVVSGSAYGAWVDLREGEGFGTTYALEVEPGMAVFVPRGVGNGYQTTSDATAYSYLVNDHWRPDAHYVAVDHADPELAIAWPLPPGERILSGRDRSAPRLTEVTPVPVRTPLVIGAGGQVGRALLAAFPDARGVTRTVLDLIDRESLGRWPWREHDVVLNAAAYTAVDAAETPTGRRQAWAVNATGPATLARLATRHGFTLVHFSTDYVYDGTAVEHDEDEPPAPLGVYGESKAAGDAAVATTPRHYLVRTSWVIGDGPNFVRTMAGLADEGATPSVVADQVGRLGFAGEIARATRHLVERRAAYGTYQVSNGGPPRSWADIAREVFELRGRSPDDVRPVTTEEYAEGRATAPRPANSVLSLRKLEATGFVPVDAGQALRSYLATLPASRP
ncbi:MAG TPA: bifunctional dTDP-4-dehydrorhamnose 3,5-epimerase family protein/NAD(P)-dependent oxidoreductase [Nocardioides sp.]|uniref:bifunctional dTDP-4-dehydrorhamnose 3,5-epimerase family protein/NAD(P)-dependent oxidoreductase n=1 Tax=Nocardioides sp. TaxID=35761 RepID=UPI002F41B581